MVTEHRVLCSLVTVSLIAGGASAALNGHCPPLGPVLPAPVRASENKYVKKAAAALNETFSSLISSWGDAAVSVAVSSIYEDAPLIKLHHTPRSGLNSSGVSTADANSVYRIGSCSKMFTALAVLKLHGVDLSDKVTKYLPQLRNLKNEVAVNNPITTANWDEVTLESLASHLSGIGADWDTDFAGYESVYHPASYGLPEVANSSLPSCSGFDLRVCTEADFYHSFGKRPPVWSPYSEPVYSNMGYSILGLVIEAVSNKTWGDYVDTQICAPLGLTRTTTSKPDDSHGVIMSDDVWWNTEFGFEAPSGSIYSSANDMIAFGTAILTHRALSPVDTRRWMKPHTSTSSLGYMLGVGWEVFRTTNLTEDKRLIELYTKSGNAGSYNSHLALLADYGLVISILQVGQETSTNTILATLNWISSQIIPAVDKAGKDEASAALVGTWVDKATNSSLTLKVDKGPGLALTDWTVRDVDVVQAILGNGTTGSVRLYPTDLKAGNDVSYRAVFETGSAKEIAAEDSQVFWPQMSCLTWETVDRNTYMYKSLDQLLFKFSEDQSGVRKAVGINLPAFKVTLVRQ